MARLRVKRRSPQESQPAQHRVHLASGAAGLGWPRHKDGRRAHVQGSLLQPAPRRKARDRGAPRKRYKDQPKRQLALAKISHQSWQQEASDRDSWRSSVRKASRKFEVERHEPAKERSRRQKERAESQSSSAQTFVCPKRISRVCAPRIRLYSHRQACRDCPSISLPQNPYPRGISHHIFTKGMEAGIDYDVTKYGRDARVR